MRTIVNIVLTATAIMLSAWWTPAPAHADDMTHDAALFCRWLDIDNTPAGVMSAVNEFLIQGVGHDATVATITYALENLCPEYIDEVQYTHAYYGPRMAV